METGKAGAFAIFNYKLRRDACYSYDPVYEGMIVGISSKAGDLELMF